MSNRHNVKTYSFVTTDEDTLVLTTYHERMRGQVLSGVLENTLDPDMNKYHATDKNAIQCEDVKGLEIERERDRTCR